MDKFLLPLLRNYSNPILKRAYFAGLSFKSLTMFFEVISAVRKCHQLFPSDKPSKNFAKTFGCIQRLLPHIFQRDLLRWSLLRIIGKQKIKLNENILLFLGGKSRLGQGQKTWNKLNIQYGLLLRLPKIK